MKLLLIIGFVLIGATVITLVGNAFGIPGWVQGVTSFFWGVWVAVLFPLKTPSKQP
jgi:hypothetical protein